MIAVSIVLSLVLLGSAIYAVLSIIAAYFQTRASHNGTNRLCYAQTRIKGGEIPISVLKPLSGNEPFLERNIRSFFEQDYTNFELLFAVRREDDAAAGIVRRLRDEYPHVRSRLFFTGEPPYANAKVFSLSKMTALAEYEWLVMSDSDVRVSGDFLRRLSAEFASGRYDLATCPYRAIPSRSPWSLLEALGMNTEFWSTAFVAKLVEGVRFTIGPTVAARRSVFAAIPWQSLSSFLAEDFVLGQRAAAAGFRVDLSQVVVEHHLSDESMAENLSHRLRWARSTRRSRPLGYVGQLFTNPLPMALAVVALNRRLWPALAVTAVLRAASGYFTACALGDTLTRGKWWLVPIQDLLSFLFWIAGFTGNHIAWRGRRYRLRRDGTFELKTES